MPLHEIAPGHHRQHSMKARVLLHIGGEARLGKLRLCQQVVDDGEAIARLGPQSATDAALGSEAYRAAMDELARIEIRIADVDRSANPPRG